MRIILLTSFILLTTIGSYADDKVAPANAIKAETVPVRKFPELQPKGKPYQVPDTNWEVKPILWGWTCELADGTGIAFGGIHQLSDDGIAHTQIKVGAEWKLITEDLRKENPLQKYYDQVRALRNNTKDTLARARHIYFEGKTAEEEGKLLKEIDISIDKINKDITKLMADLKGLTGLDSYALGQVKFGTKHLEAAIPFIKPFGALTTPELMASMRKGQIELEIAGEAFEAEPPPRSLSRIAYDEKTKLFVIFGGEHFDYQVNDLWVFDLAKKKWYQRHADSSPEPRADHLMEAAGDGRIIMWGGYCYGQGYVHAGSDRWIYDIEKNIWSADNHQEKPMPSDTRSARYFPPAGPEHYMTGPRPDAAANEQKLKSIPVNTWVKLKTAVPMAGHRDWGTWVHDTDRDMLYVYGGGHVSYPGNDVLRYHMATDRWEMTDPIEIPIGCAGTNEKFPGGFNYNQRPWCKKHVWNSQTYDPTIKKMIMSGVTDQRVDPYSYIYDPDKSDWAGRFKVVDGMPISASSINLRWTKQGVLGWAGDGIWMLDSKTLTWKKVVTKGKMAGSGVDSCGMVYDPKRDRMLFVTQNGYGKPFDGQITALDMNTFQAEKLNPEGMEVLNPCQMFLRESAYHPESDMFIWNQLLTKNGKAAKNMFLGYDAGKNRWVYIKIDGGSGPPFEGIGAVCSGIKYDEKRGLFFVGNSAYEGGVHVMRFDLSKVEIVPIKDYVFPAAEVKK